MRAAMLAALPKWSIRLQPRLAHEVRNQARQYPKDQEFRGQISGFWTRNEGCGTRYEPISQTLDCFYERLEKLARHLHLLKIRTKSSEFENGG